MSNTPEQHRNIDARLAKADEDIKHGRVYGPFNTAEEMAGSIEDNIKNLRAVRRKAKPALANRLQLPLDLQAC
jgi:hypothetical protein